MKRSYATYWEFPDEAARDKGIVCSLVEALGHTEFDIAKRSLKHRGHEDPPDCEARDSQGRRIAFELSELVDPEAVRRHTKKEGPHFREYSAAEFLDLLEQRLDAKMRSETDLKGGPYYRRILLLHTDEGMLDASFCRTALLQRKSRQIPPWTDVFLIFPPLPRFSGEDSHQLSRHDIIAIKNVP